MARLLIEKFLPIALGALTLLVCLIWRAQITHQFATHHLSVGGLYTAVFGWSAIQTGFLFGVFGFVVGTSDGFISDVKESAPMRRFLSYTRNGTLMGFLLTFASMPLIVMEAKVEGGFLPYVAISTWFSLFIWTFFAFARVAYLFGLLMRPERPRMLPG